MKKILWIVFIVTAVAQLGVPAYLVIRQENTLCYGQQLKLKTKPIDPYDAFRGKFVRLSFEEERIPYARFDKTFKRDYRGKAFIAFEQDNDGFSKIKDLTTFPTPNSFPVFVSFISQNEKHPEKDEIHLDFPFDRYYMEETKAPKAEKLYRDHSRNERDAAVLIRVYKGYAALEDLLIDDKPVREVLKTR